MKKIYTAITTFLVAGAVLTTSAQQQPNNGNFENWDGNGDPAGWNDMRTGELCGFCGVGSSQRIFEDNSIVRSGNASVRVESADAFGNIVNGTMTTGKIHAPSTTPSQGFAQTHTAETGFNHPMTDMPDSLVFYAQYNQTGTTDSAAVSVILHDNSNYRDPNGDNNQVISEARKRFQTGGAGSWVKITVPFDYSGGSTNPIAYALMTFTSSYQPGEGSNSSKLWVDDYKFIYNITPTLSENAAYVTATAGYSLSVDYSTGGTPTAATDFTVELSDATGDFTNATIIGSLNTSATSGTIACTVPAGTTDGTGYRIRVVGASEFYASVEAAFTVYNLFANAVPGTPQDIIVNEASSTNIDVDAHSEAIAFDWQFATVSGGPYSSFVPAENGLSYTPFFTATGTYYVVCEVDFGAMELLTNEVEINVDVATGIDELGETSIPVYNVNGQLMVDLRNTELNVPTYELYNMNGQRVATGSLASRSINKLPSMNTGIYVIRVIHADGMFTSKVFVN